jgi:hypothetical protein
MFALMATAMIGAAAGILMTAGGVIAADSAWMVIGIGTLTGSCSAVAMATFIALR